MGVGFGTIIAVAIAVLATWILVVFIGLPPELISPELQLFIRGLPYIELQFLFILGGDPITYSEDIYHGILLNTGVFPQFNVIIWIAVGFVGGIFTQSIIKGLAVGINTGIITTLIGWFLYWAILYGFDVNAIMSSEMLYLLSDYLVDGLIVSSFAIIGGVFGGAVGRQSSKTNQQ
ncbi:MAG: hypothetical protein ACTSQY_04540 [Candidatus Odinarchaeia archaeon]